ncbi:MAG: hypothetical protein LC640_09235 [Frankia sp.]|nr:hypothetical protein [Frankia sp.]
MNEEQPAPACPLPSDDRRLAERLARLNHRTRNAYWSERRHGKSEEAALAAAERTLPR